MLGTVLLVDTDVQIRRQLRRYIMMSGVRASKILECDNGVDALRICQMEQVSLLLTELELAELTGIELIRQINDMKNAPLAVVISGKKEFSDVVELMRQNVKDYLTKPVNRKRVFELLQRMDAEQEKLQAYRDYCDSLQAEKLQRLLVSSSLEEIGETSIPLEQQILTQLEHPYIVVCGSVSEEQLRERPEIILNIVNEERQNVLIIEEKDTRRFLEELRGCTAGISLVHQGIDELSAAYAESWQARKNAFFEGRTHRYSETEANMRKGRIAELDSTEIHLIEQTVNRIGTDRLEDAVNQILTLMQQVESGKKTPEQFEAMIRYFADHAEKVYQNVIHEMEADSGVRNIYEYQSSREYQKVLIDWMYELNSIIESRFGDYKNKQKIQEALRFIHENYQTNLNMAVVTNHVSMNYSLFSYSFKQYTGSNFVDYLKNLRIREARKLLEETDMLIMDVSRAVGYDNEKHFMKVFKAECGVSPSEYRKNLLYRL